MPVRPKIVGVVSREAFSARSRLWRALELVLPVRFEARDLDEISRDGLDALIIVGPHASAWAPADKALLPTFVAQADASSARAGTVRFTDAGALDHRLRARSFLAAHVGELAGAEGDALAMLEGRPLWVRAHSPGANVDRVAAELFDLDAGEVLASALFARRSFALLALVHFLRAVSADIAFAPPPPRAAFIIDDPNLHRMSYGYLDYREVIRSAKAQRYHLAIATVPLDGWYADGRAIRLFRENPDVLSLAIHGNNHTHEELAQSRSVEEATALAAEALRRVDRFAARFCVPVARVMVPPHGVCAEVMARAMLNTGFEAMCCDRPYPWHDSLPPDRPLAGFEQTELVAGGLPIMTRFQFSNAEREILLRQFLDQPVIAYGHHDDLKDGLAPFERIAAEVNRVAGVKWASLADIARAGLSTRRIGDSLEVRLFARRARLEIPPGVRSIAVEAPIPEEASREERVRAGAAQTVFEFDPPGVRRTERALAVTPNERSVEIELLHPDAVRSFEARHAGSMLWPVVRRLLTETRDRAHPLIAQVRQYAGGAR
jgi:hypothetical protein